MSEFSITEAAYAGFRITRERPKALAVWALVCLIEVALVLVVMGPLFDAVQALSPQDMSDQVKLAHVIDAYSPRLGLMIPINLIASALFHAAMNRAVFHPNEDRFGYLRLGVDELKQLGLQVALAGISVLAKLAGQLLGALGGGSPGAMAIGAIATLALWVVIATRLSLASPMIMETGRIDMVGAWRLTHGRLGALLRTYLVISGLCAAVFLLALVVVSAVTALAGTAADGLRAATPLAAPLMAFFDHGHPGYMVSTSIGLGLTLALISPIWLTPAAVIYLRLTRSGGVVA